MDAAAEAEVSQNSPHPPAEPVNLNRLSLPYVTRVYTGGFAGFALGMFSGAIYGSRMASLRFRAENSHRLPKSDKGWYLYHKRKNYLMILEGLQRGAKRGLFLAVLVGGFFIVEEAVDRYMGRQEFWSTCIAGSSFGGVYSIWHKLPRHTYMRTIKLATYSGLAFGLIQDTLSLAKGRRLGYVDFLLRRDQRSYDARSKIV